MFSEITRLQKQGQLTKVSGIISHYIDKGLYEDDCMEEPVNGYKKSNHGSKADSFYLTQSDAFTTPRSRVDKPADSKVTSTPMYRSRSESLGHSRRMYDDSFNTPNRSSSFNISGIEPITPSPDRRSGYDYEKVSPAVASSGHEIYPHRRSNSFRNNFSTSFEENGDNEDLKDDLEVQKYLSKQPVGKLDFDNDDGFLQRAQKKDYRRVSSPSASKSPMGRGLSFSDLNDENRAKKQLVFSPYLMNKEPNGLTARKYANRSPYENTKETVECIVESPIDNKYRDDYQKLSNQRPRYGAPSPDNDKSFIKALEYAVQQESNSIQKIYDGLDLDHVPTRQSRNYSPSISRQSRKSPSPSPSRSGSGLKGILKNAKSETNLSIKEGRTTPRSFYSHSASPARTPTKDVTSYGSQYGTADFMSGKYGATKGKPLFSGPSKRAGIVRNPRDFFDDSLSSQPSPYQHQPL